MISHKNFYNSPSSEEYVYFKSDFKQASNDVKYYEINLLNRNVNTNNGNNKHIKSWVFIPKNYDTKSTMFYIPGSKCEAFFEEPTRKFCSYLSSTLNTRVICVFHNVSSKEEKNRFPTPINDIFNTINFHLQYIDVFKHNIYLSGYSSGGYAAIITCLEAVWSRIPISWLFLIAPAVNLFEDENQRHYERDKIISNKKFYNEFLDKFLPIQSRDQLRLTLSPMKKSQNDYKGFPMTTIVVGEKDALLDEIEEFSGLVKSSTLKVVKNFDHSLPWKNNSFLSDYNIYPATKYTKNHLVLHYSPFNQIIPVYSANEINKVLHLYSNTSPPWFEKNSLIKNYYYGRAFKIATVCLSATSYFKYYHVAESSKIEINLTDLLNVINSLNLYYLCINRNTETVEQSLRIKEYILDYANNREFTYEIKKQIALEKIKYLNDRSLQAHFDRNVLALDNFTNATLYFFNNKSTNFWLPEILITELQKDAQYAIALTYRGHFHLKSKQYKAALSCYIKALAVKRNYYKEDNVDVAGTIEDIGNVMREIGNNKVAKYYLKKALEIKINYYKDDIETGNLAYSYRSVGDIYLLMGKYDKSLKMYNMAKFQIQNERIITQVLEKITLWLTNSTEECQINTRELTILKKHPAYYSGEKILNLLTQLGFFSNIHNDGNKVFNDNTNPLNTIYKSKL